MAAPISVVIPARNHRRFISEAILSVCTQTLSVSELIVIDDGSTDDTQQILDRFSAVRSIHQPNRGLSAARNVGLEAATGEIVAYTDSDCFAHRDWLTLLVAQLERTGAAAARAIPQALKVAVAARSRD